MKYLISATAIVLMLIALLFIIKCIFVYFDFWVFLWACMYLVLTIALIQHLKTTE